MYEEYYERVREECLIRNRSSRTADVYVHNISHFMTWTGNKQMKDLTLQDARNFILDKRRSGAKASTCNFYNSSICFLYKHVLHIQWDQDTVPRMKLDKKLPETLTLEEIEKLIDTATDIRNKAIIALLYSSGIRVLAVILTWTLQHICLLIQVVFPDRKTSFSLEIFLIHQVQLFTREIT